MLSKRIAFPPKMGYNVKKSTQGGFPMFQIRDTVHGYIELDGIYADIVDTPEFQRLRSIEQGSFRPVFPCARHDRFIHSLGTFHLASRFVEHFFRNIREDLPAYCLTANEQKRLTATFRYAALLHDIGHAPYSHTTENFFLLRRDKAGTGPAIVEELRDAVISAADPAEQVAFRADYPNCDPSAHEIVSATVLITEKSKFLGKRSAWIDLPLAARMVTGCVYDYSRYPNLSDHDRQLLGVKNCLIRLLNSSAVDVDRLDYLIRDTQMSGFINAPVDVERLASAVTAVNHAENGWLYPAFRNSALGVLDAMFHAKREHDFWVLCHPTGAYDAELRMHCIRRLDTFHGNKDYMTTVFTPKALSRTGIMLYGRPYRLLCDSDITADLKRQMAMDPLFSEIFYRESRRVPAWKDYYEYRWLFQDPAAGLTEDKVFGFFLPLMEYMDEKCIFQLDDSTCRKILTASDADAGAKDAAVFLKDFFAGVQTRADAARAARDAKKKQAETVKKEYPPVFDVVLIRRTVNLSYKFNPNTTYIRFRKQPARGSQTYATYAFLKHPAGDPPEKAKQDKRNMFYLFTPRFVMTDAEKAAFRDALTAKLCPPAPAAIPRA